MMREDKKNEAGGHRPFQSQQDPNFREAIRHLHRGEAAQAQALLEPLLAAHPEDIEIILNLGGAYVLLEDYEAAQALLEPAASAHPDVANLWVNLGAARLGRLETSSRDAQDDAIAAYEHALAADPNVPNVHYMLGLIYQARSDNLRAAAHLARALEQSPDDRHVQRLLQAASRDAARANAKNN
ncbi:MAG: tetratricopeptide repeat protein [Anaerolineales bacterium]|nr:tetratricopeptide repeat protein [Anaerolineales bacterium]MCB9128578.1 tetratricopeptide repeat protein [Ardenticatenales bacterium]